MRNETRTIIATIRAENKSLLDNLQKHNNILQEQMQALSQAYVEQSANFKNGPEVLNLFPIKNMEELKYMDAEINADNRYVYINTMRNLLQPGGVLKHLRFILSDEVIMGTNIDGVQGKTALKTFSRFYNALIAENTTQLCTQCGRAQGEFKQLKETVQKQNAAVMETLASQTALIRSLIRQESISRSAFEDFPLKNQEELYNLNSKINDENFDAYVAVIKSLIRNQPKKHIKNVLAESLIVDFNLDGTHGKGRLKDFKVFYSTLREAVDAEDPDRTIRQSLQIVKKRHFQSVSAFNKKLKVAE